MARRAATIGASPAKHVGIGDGAAARRRGGGGGARRL